MTPTAPRFYCEPGGQLIADRRPVSLEWAEEAVSQWFRDARRERLRGNYRLADEYRRQAMALSGAIIKAEAEQHRAGPNAAEAYTRTVERMLKASVEQGERA